MSKVVLLGSYAPSLINFRGTLLKAMILNGHKVIACAPGVDQIIEESLLQIGVASYSVPLQRAGVNPIMDYRTVIALKKKFFRERPDVVLCYTIKPVIYGSLAARSAGVPDTYSMITGLGYAFSGNTIKQKVVGKVAQTLYREALKNNTKVFFQNPDDRDLFLRLRLVKNEQIVITNGSGVDLEHYQNVDLPKDVSFLLIARLIKEKGILEYVEAARIVKERYPEVNFTLVGWLDDDSPSVINPELLKKLQHKGIIDFKGKMEDVRSAIANTTIYVLPSYREGTPRTVLEAMSMGRPIITTDTPGCREPVINGTNGFLVPHKNPAALAEAMEMFILRPELIRSMGMESRRIATEKYDVHKVNDLILRAMGLRQI